MRYDSLPLFITISILIIELTAVLFIFLPRKSDYSAIINRLQKSNKDKEQCSFFYKCVKRFIDCIFGLFGLIIFMPIFILVYIALCLENVQYPLQKYYCLGYRRKIAKYYRFNLRNEKKELTIVGRFLFKSGLEFLPLILSVFTGDLTLIGLNRIDLGRELNYKEKCYLYDYEKPSFLPVGKLILMPGRTTEEIEYLYLKARSISLDFILFRYMVSKILLAPAK